jgi:hypothetical protein
VNIKGRKPTPRAKTDDVKALHAEGLSMGQIAKHLQIDKGSVHRPLNGPTRTREAPPVGAADGND